MKSQKKILFIYYKLFKIGGIANVLTTLTNELVEQGYDVKILLLMKKHNEFYQLDKRIKKVYLDSFGHWAFSKLCVGIDKYLRFIPKRQNIKNYLYDYGAYNVLNKWLLENHKEYETIISCWYKLSSYISLNREITKKTIAWEHSSFNVRGFFFGTIMRPRYRRFKNVVCLNKPSVNYYKELNKNTLRIPNIIYEKNEYISIKNKENLITFLGRIDKSKNVLELIKIVEIVNNFKDRKLQIIGDGPELNNLKKYVNYNQLNDRVIFYGRKSKEESKQLLDKSKIFVFTSKTEALPLVLIEALFCSNAIIAYNCNYGPSDIVNSNNGYLIPMNDRKLFIEKLEYLINKEEALVVLNQNSFKEAQQWKKQRAIQQWKNII